MTGDKKYALIRSCIDAFQSVSACIPSSHIAKYSVLVNVILVVGHEKLNVEMQRMFGSASVSVVKIPKSGGVWHFRSGHFTSCSSYLTL